MKKSPLIASCCSNSKEQGIEPTFSEISISRVKFENFFLCFVSTDAKNLTRIVAQNENTPTIFTSRRFFCFSYYSLIGVPYQILKESLGKACVSLFYDAMSVKFSKSILPNSSKHVLQLILYTLLSFRSAAFALKRSTFGVFLKIFRPSFTELVKFRLCQSL